MAPGRGIPSSEPESVTVITGPTESPSLIAMVRSRGPRVARLPPPLPDRPATHPDRSPARLAQDVAARLVTPGHRTVVAIGAPWLLGIAAQARAAALDPKPGRWLLWPSTTDTLGPGTPPDWAHETAALDHLARASASWIASPGPAGDATLPDAAGPDGRAWVRWLDTLPHPAQDLAARAQARARRITLGVVLVHRDRPTQAAAALESLAAQTRRPDALAVVDAASADPTAVAAVRTRLAVVHPTPARLIERDTPSLGAARRAGAEAVTTDWLLFLDDDNRLPPEALATFARAAATETADIWTCWAALVHGDGPPPADPDMGPVYRPLGPVPGLAGTANVLGDANLLIRRDTFFRLGGFDPDPTTGAEDWDLLVRALLAGIPQAVIPRVLLWKRQAPSGMAATMDHARARNRVLRHLRAARVPV